MQIHELKPNHKLKGKKRVGRGGKKGTYSGRGGKGQTARAGRKMEPFIREIIKRYPKLKGYRSFSMPGSSISVSIETVEKNFNDGEVVNVQNLANKKIIGRTKGKYPDIKIIGREKLTKKIVFEGVKFSKSAKEAVEKSGSLIK